MKHCLSTRVLLRRRNMVLDYYSCVLRNTRSYETFLHLFLFCLFVDSYWSTLHLYRADLYDPFAILESFKTQIALPFFMDILVTMIWSIWLGRNDLNVRGIAHSIQRSKKIFKKEFGLLLRAKAKHHSFIDQWQEAYV